MVGAAYAATPPPRREYSPEETAKYTAALKLEAAGILPDAQKQALDTIRQSGDLPPIQFKWDDPIIEASAKKYGLGRSQLLGVLSQEAGPQVNGAWDPAVIGAGDSQGLMQVTLPTGKPYGLTELNRTNPWLNVEIGAHHLSDLMTQTKGNWQKALRLYNNVDPNYVTSVLKHGANWDSYLASLPSASVAGQPQPPGTAAAEPPPPPPPGGVPSPGPEQPPPFVGPLRPPTDQTFGQTFERRYGAAVPPPRPEETIAGVPTLRDLNIPFEALNTALGAGAQALSGSKMIGDITENVARYAPLVLGGRKLLQSAGEAVGGLTPKARALTRATAAETAAGERVATQGATRTLARTATAQRLDKYGVNAVNELRAHPNVAGLAPQDRQLFDTLIQHASTTTDRIARSNALQVAENMLGGKVTSVRKLVRAQGLAGTAAAQGDIAEAAAARALQAAQAEAARAQTAYNQPGLVRSLMKGGIRLGVRYGLPIGGASVLLSKWLK